MKKVLLFVLGLLCCTPAYADSTIDGLGAAGALAGTESVPIFQTANPAVKTTAAAIANTFTAGNASNLGSGTLPAGRMPALTGDCVTTAGAVATSCDMPHPGYIANGYYIPGGIAADASGSAVAANTIYCTYGYIPKKVTIGTLGVRIGTAGSTNLQLAVYANSNGLPGALISNTGNIVNTSASTAVAGAMGANKQLGPGGADGSRDLWFCFNNGDSTATFNAVATNATMSASFVGTATLANILGSSAVTVLGKSCAGANCNGGSSTLGTWPATLAGSTWSDVITGVMPAIFFRVVSFP